MKEAHSIGRIEFGIEQKTLPLKTINYVRKLLPSWRDDPDRPNDISEPKLNSHLCKYLNTRRSREKFPMVFFNHEEPQAPNRSVDISATASEQLSIGAKLYSIYEPFIVIECKRLPAPALDREKEYVTGGIRYKSGAIQRFKLGLHGADMNLVVIIGYVQKFSFNYWIMQINKWIAEMCLGIIPDGCIWSDTEMLENIEKNRKKGISMCQSVHNRNGSVSSPIEIRHLWITMDKSAGKRHKSKSKPI